MSSILLAIKTGILVASLISHKYKAFALIEQQDVRHLFSHNWRIPISKLISVFAQPSICHEMWSRWKEFYWNKQGWTETSISPYHFPLYDIIFANLLVMMKGQAAISTSSHYLRQVWNSVLYSGKFLGDYWILTHWDCVFDIWLYQHFSLSSGNLSLYPGSYFSLESEDKWVPFDTEDHSVCMAKHLKSFYHGSHSFSKKFQLTLVFPILYF